MTNVNSVDSDIKMTDVIFRSCNVLQSESFRGQNVRGPEESDKERKAKRRAAMTKEEKTALQEKDRLRRAMKKTSHVDGRTLP